MQDPAPKKKTIYIWIGLLLGAVAAIWLLVRYNLTLDDIKLIGRDAATMARSAPLLVFIILTCAHLTGMILSLPTKGLLTILSGALLGPVLGVGTTLTGTLVGTTILFVMARRFLRERFERSLEKSQGVLGRRGTALKDKLASHPIRALIGLRLMITLPYGPITLITALSPVKYRDFIIGSLIGDIPVVVLYSLAGERLFALTSVSEALSPSTIAILIIAGGIIFAGALFGKKKTTE